MNTGKFLVLLLVATCGIQAIDDEFDGYIHIKNKNLNDDGDASLPISNEACQTECDIRGCNVALYGDGQCYRAAYPDDGAVDIYISNSTCGGGTKPAFTTGSCSRPNLRYMKLSSYFTIP